MVDWIQSEKMVDLRVDMGRGSFPPVLYTRCFLHSHGTKLLILS